MDVLFNLALKEGRVDDGRGTFDFGDNSIINTDIETLRESNLLTGEEMDQLEEAGAVLI